VQYNKDLKISKIIIIQKYFKKRRLRQIIINLIKTYKNSLDLNSKKWLLFEKYSKLEPGIIESIFKDPK